MLNTNLSASLLILAVAASAAAQDVPLMPDASPPPLKDVPAPPAPPVPPTPPLAPKVYQTFSYGAARFWSPQPSPLLLRLTPMEPQVATDWNEDLRVMNRLLHDALERAGHGDAPQAMGIRIRLLDSGQGVYIENFGVLLTAETSIPLASGGKATTQTVEKAPVDAWEAARRELTANVTATDDEANNAQADSIAARIAEAKQRLTQSKLSDEERRASEQAINAMQTSLDVLRHHVSESNRRFAVATGATPPELFDPAKLQQLIDTLANTIAEARHFRHLAADNVVWLTVSGTDDAGKPMRLNLRVSKADLDQYGRADTREELLHHITHFVE